MIRGYTPWSNKLSISSSSNNHLITGAYYLQIFPANALLSIMMWSQRLSRIHLPDYINISIPCFISQHNQITNVQLVKSSHGFGIQKKAIGLFKKKYGILPFWVFIIIIYIIIYIIYNIIYIYIWVYNPCKPPGLSHGSSHPFLLQGQVPRTMEPSRAPEKLKVSWDLPIKMVIYSGFSH